MRRQGSGAIVNVGSTASLQGYGLLGANTFAGTTALKRYGTPEEIADPVFFLLSDSSSSISGTAISIDGGVTTGV